MPDETPSSPHSCECPLYLIIPIYLLLLVNRSIHGMSLKIWILHGSSSKNCKLVKKIPQMRHLWADNETSAINTAVCTNVHLVKAPAAEGAQLWASINPITKHLPGELMWPLESNRRQWKAVALRFCQSHKISISMHVSSSSFPLKNADGLRCSSQILPTNVSSCILLKWTLWILAVTWIWELNCFKCIHKIRLLLIYLKEPSLVLSTHLLLAITCSLSRSQVVLESIQTVPERQEYTLNGSPVNHTLTISHSHTLFSLQSENRDREEDGESPCRDGENIHQREPEWASCPRREQRYHLLTTETQYSLTLGQRDQSHDENVLRSRHRRT